MELSTCLPQNLTLQKQSLQVAEQCLEANQENDGHEQIFERLAESRVNLALMLVQRVVNSTPSAGDVAQLLNALWSTISSVGEPYASDNIGLYRTLLKLLYVTLRAQVRAFNQSAQTPATAKEADRYAVEITQTVLSIVDITVAKGFRTLVTLVHESDTTVLPEDVALLTAILQACLCMPGIDQSQTQILNILAAHDAVHVAVSLYSWSDKLAGPGGDPVYGELSLLFLLELSALPSVAEQLACDGLLNHLTSANLAAYLRRPGVSPFAESVGPQRCYSIWAKGIVPLLLNVLAALGATIAPEVAYVLNQFPNLTRAAVERLDVPVGNRMQPAQGSTNGAGAGAGYVTLLSVSELHSLALMARVLGVLREAGAGTGAGSDGTGRGVPALAAWDADKALENVDFWLGSRKLLRDRLAPLAPREAEWRAAPPTTAADLGGAPCESLLEEKVVEQLSDIRAVLGEELDS